MRVTIESAEGSAHSSSWDTGDNLTLRVAVEILNALLSDAADAPICELKFHLCGKNPADPTHFPYCHYYITCCHYVCAICIVGEEPWWKG